MARVIVSAGHTQKEPGAVVDDLKEVDLTHKITNKITQKLRNKGIITLSVPPELDLTSRINWINKTGYREESDDICIEIHINDGGKTGLEGWFKERGKNKSQELTRTIIEEACKLTILENQGVKSEYDHPLQSLAFIHNTNPTSSLIECLYIDNPKDQTFLKDDSKLNLLADGIVNGILKFFGILRDDSRSISPPMGTGQQPPTSFPPQARSTFTPPPPMQASPRSFPSFSPSSTYPGVAPFGSGIEEPKSKEDRKKIVKDLYHQTLGRKVNEQDLNYFLNLGLTEDQMIKRLVESQEHADMVKDYQEYKKIKPEYDKLKMENQKLSTQVRDKEELIKKQNELIVQKNRTIQELQQPTTPSTSNTMTFQQSPQIADSEFQPLPPAKETFLDRILRKLNDIFD